MENDFIFKYRLKIARKKRGMSQSVLAHVSDLQPSAISHFETGNRQPCLRNLAKLALALNVSADYLLGLHNN